ncbi:hypothetical protein PGTUg99_019624 [Puccinia graminis f. sp. tritici]|uniref:Uncharacterized protein n=1 Tax=Puccinia graminis f. sp. tritici TaxID=56615 RepID=A0A5B0RWW2_PUCGR|nr:hypothetical protein PGTUg99_019624 [Puccinia graminis f. sp. tritici]
MVHHSRERIAHKIDKNIWFQLPGDKRDKWFCRLCGGGGRGSKAANRYIHEATPIHKAKLQRRAQLAQAEEEAATLLARGPSEMQWTSAHDEPPEPHPPSEDVPCELQDDLQFIDLDEYFDDPDVPKSAASPSTSSSEDGGWDGMIPDDSPPVDFQTPHTAGTAEGSRAQKKKNIEWWPFRAKEVSHLCS